MPITKQPDAAAIIAEYNNQHYNRKRIEDLIKKAAEAGPRPLDARTANPKDVKIYWIEPEIYLNPELERQIKHRFGKENLIELSEGAEQALARLEEDKNVITATKAPIIMELHTGPHGSPEPIQNLNESDKLGLVTKIQEMFGKDHPIIIYSGNVTLGAKESLVDNHNIPLERIITKPLNEKLGRLLAELQDIINQTTKSSSLIYP